MSLSRTEIVRLLHELNDELKRSQEKAELYLVGGAVMCLVMKARESTNDVDSFFVPTDAIRKAAGKIAVRNDLPGDWLNDGVKGFLSDTGDYLPYLELSNLRILTAAPEYLLAMKCLAMRLGIESHDESDIRFLLRYLNIEDYDRAIAVISRYYPIERFPQKTLYALEEILQKSASIL